MQPLLHWVPLGQCRARGWAKGLASWAQGRAGAGCRSGGADRHSNPSFEQHWGRGAEMERQAQRRLHTTFSSPCAPRRRAGTHPAQCRLAAPQKDFSYCKPRLQQAAPSQQLPTQPAQSPGCAKGPVVCGERHLPPFPGRHLGGHAPAPEPCTPVGAHSRGAWGTWGSAARTAACRASPAHRARRPLPGVSTRALPLGQRRSQPDAGGGSAAALASSRRATCGRRLSRHDLWLWKRAH